MCDNINSQGDCQLPSGEQSSGVTVATRMGVIYQITNKINGKIYVGKTKQKLDTRMTQHKYDSKNGSPGLGAAIAKYGWENFTVEVIEVCPVKQLNEREKFWIAALNSKAPNGYNLTDGGDGLVGCTQETRDKMSLAKKGKKRKPHSSETRAKMSAKAKGRPSSNKGKHLSEETRAKLSVSNTGKKHTSETRAKISASNKGENNPNYGKHRSPETKAKISAAEKGKHLSEETRAKISAARKAYFARKKAVENGDKK